MFEELPEVEVAAIANRRRKALLLLLVGVAILTNGWLSVPISGRHSVPYLRFSWSVLNGLAVFGAVVMLSVGAVMLYRTLPRKWAKGFALVGALGLLALCSPFGMFVVFWGFAPVEPIATAELGGVRITAERFNPGACCSFGILVRQERRLVPGLVLRRTLEGWYPAREADLVVLAPDRVRIAVPIYRGPDRGKVHKKIVQIR